MSALSPAERAKIKLYLNFDMIASPNYVFGIYDGDSSGAVVSATPPPGSGQIEKLFQAYFTAVGEPYQDAEFSGRSDYGPFIAIGIPSGGLFTGAERLKTAEEAEKFGGTAGVAYDKCYHQACDTIANVNEKALEVNSGAIATAAFVYAYARDLPSAPNTPASSSGPGVSKGPEGPVRVPRGPARVPRGPARVPRGPARVPRGPARVPRGPARVPSSPASRTTPIGEPARAAWRPATATITSTAAFSSDSPSPVTPGRRGVRPGRARAGPCGVRPGGAGPCGVRPGARGRVAYDPGKAGARGRKRERACASPGGRGYSRGMSSGELRVLGACPLDCPDTCSWVVTVQDGSAVEMRGNPDHPYTRGALCVKVNRYLEHTRAADRILHPMRRVGPKGSGRFERISWDEALEEISVRLRDIVDEHGGEAIWPYLGTGTLGYVQGSEGSPGGGSGTSSGRRGTS